MIQCSFNVLSFSLSSPFSNELSSFELKEVSLSRLRVMRLLLCILNPLLVYDFAANSYSNLHSIFRRWRQSKGPEDYGIHLLRLHTKENVQVRLWIGDICKCASTIGVFFILWTLDLPPLSGDWTAFDNAWWCICGQKICVRDSQSFASNAC